MTSVFIVVLNWNQKEFTLGCVKSLNKLRTNGLKLQTVVVDNGSTDDSVKTFRKELPNEVVLENKENLGFAAGNNVGIEYSLSHGADYIMLLNNDTYVGENLIEELIKVGESEAKITVLGPKIYFAPGYEFHKDRYSKQERGKVFWYAGGQIDWDNVLASHRGVDQVDQGQFDDLEETDFVSGAAMMIKRDVLEKIGPLDPKYFLYYEDSDFCQRAKEAGFKVIYVPEAVVWHYNAGSSSSGSPLQEYYISRNRLLFAARFAPVRAKFAIFRESLKYLLLGPKWKRRGARDFYLGKFGKGSYQP